MLGFLKCYYGYKNLGDELIFRGILDYIDRTYPKVDDLTVQVAQIEWMQARRSRNIDQIRKLKIAPGFTEQRKIVKFVPTTKDIRDNIRYDVYFFGGGEVFAESRGFHGGRNYFLRYPLPFIRGRVVLLGGIETPIGVRQKLLYRLSLPRVHHIVCRDATSYQVAQGYTTKVALHHDFALSLCRHYRQYIDTPYLHSLNSQDPYDIEVLKKRFGDLYILVNMIGSMSNEESYARIDECIKNYPGHTIVYVPCGTDDAGRDDAYYAHRLQGAYPEMLIYDWTAHSVIQTLYLFEHAAVGIGCRLHFLLLLQEFERPRYALAYAEKINKLITSTIELS